jgi:hypothetical protein
MRDVLREGSLHDVADLLMAPARSGVVLTRPFLLRTAQELGISASSIVRKQFLENLFLEAGRGGKLPELLQALMKETYRWRKLYDHFGASHRGIKKAVATQAKHAKWLAGELKMLQKEASRLRREAGGPS